MSMLSENTSGTYFDKFRTVHWAVMNMLRAERLFEIFLFGRSSRVYEVPGAWLEDTLASGANV